MSQWMVKRNSAPVVIQKTRPQKQAVLEAVSQVMEQANWRDFISHGADISVKPNLGWDKVIPGAISAPWVVEGVIITIRDYVGNISIVESNQVVCNADYAMRIAGIADICKRHNIPWVNMSKGDYVDYKDRDRLFIKNVKIPSILTRTELITVPLMKTHNKTTITGAIKNQWGCLQELRHNFHPELTRVLVDINCIIQPRFAVMDATVGLEGNGPKSGIPKEMNLVLASGNLVGIDATAARIMGFDPIQIDHLQKCAEHSLGSLNPPVLGQQVDEIQSMFIPAKHNLVSVSEILLRNSFLSKLFFQTPVFNGLTWSTRRYYDLWDLFIGRKIRKSIQSSGYFEQFRI